TKSGIPNKFKLPNDRMTETPAFGTLGIRALDFFEISTFGFRAWRPIRHTGRHPRDPPGARPQSQRKAAVERAESGERGVRFVDLLVF
ncbi:MAG: hypothetical protein ABR915_06965, partial [Thermoguttaceae bacterium]